MNRSIVLIAALSLLLVPAWARAAETPGANTPPPSTFPLPPAAAPQPAVAAPQPAAAAPQPAVAAPQPAAAAPQPAVAAPQPAAATPQPAAAAPKPRPAPQASTFQDKVSDTVVGAVDATKEFFTGVADGLKNAVSGDDSDIPRSHTVTDKAGLANLLKAEVLKLENPGTGSWLITMALRNNNDFPVKVTNLGLLGTVVLLDQEGFSYPTAAKPGREAGQDGFSYPRPNPPPPAEQDRDVVVLARSAARLKFSFTGVEGRPALFRLFDTDFGLPR